ncbi:hypothetical protein FS749_001589 [Ceratobasidium sp. UAMH 11750]|nr:hypothetical protein FS749_001589 [Ceratobasidium sp. UAMH 11750]
MSRVMLPNNLRANLKAEAMEEPAMSKTRAMKDPPDEPGAEMARGARVWRTYVKEADRLDKELVEGRNSSLDVLLIFAALFSAISTAFIIESLGDLQPDPAESSAQTLLVVSQTLAAIANGQHVTLQTQGGSSTAAFPPSRSTVAVNVLWLLSLSLSVAVSLVAMLAKDWCYIFMSGRSGPVYEQARRRQERWNGMKRWKMEQVLACLPGALHMALLLFAAGLCVYLWNINISVAVPVIVVTVSATCVYALATILPYVDGFCPYSTPATAPLKAFHLVAYLGVKWLYEKLREKAPQPRWVNSTLSQLRDWIEPSGRNPGRPTTENSLVPMDIVTSQMLAWLIRNCEDLRSVDTALQAIAGANAELPQGPLAQCEALYLAVIRLNTYTEPDTGSKELTAEELSQLSVALRYSRACITLMSGHDPETHKDRWYMTPATEDLCYWLEDRVYSKHADLFKLLDQKTGDTRMLSVAAAAAAMPLAHWKPQYRVPELGMLDKALDMVISVLKGHFQDRGTKLSPSMLRLLVEASVYYLVSRWPEEGRRDSHVLLSTLLAHVFVTSYTTAPDTARAAAVTLAAAAFACDTYPGGEKPTLGDDAREKRAADVLHYYRSHHPSQDETFALFIFGFFGLLPKLILNDQDTQLAGIIPRFKKVVDDNADLNDLLTKNIEIRTLPKQFRLIDHVIKPIYSHLSSATYDSNNKFTLATACLLPLFQPSEYLVQDQRIYLAAAIALCRTKSTDHQKLCMEVINEQGLPRAPLERLKSDDDKNLLTQLCQDLLNARTTVPVAALSFGFLIASIISGDGSLDSRQSALRPLLSLCDASPGYIKEPKPFDMGVLVSYLEQCVTDGSTGEIIGYIMQSVVDFSEGTGLTPSPGFGAGLGGGTVNADWQSRLQDLKDSYRPNLEGQKILGTEGFEYFLPALGADGKPDAASVTEMLHD